MVLPSPNSIDKKVFMYRRRYRFKLARKVLWEAIPTEREYTYICGVHRAAQPWSWEKHLTLVGVAAVEGVGGWIREVTLACGVEEDEVRLDTQRPPYSIRVDSTRAIFANYTALRQVPLGANTNFCRFLEVLCLQLRIGSSLRFLALMSFRVASWHSRPICRTLE